MKEEEIRTKKLQPMTNNLVMNDPDALRFKTAAVATLPLLVSALLHCQFVHGNVFHRLKPPFAYGSIRS
jgi:hypothetical protein